MTITSARGADTADAPVIVVGGGTMGAGISATLLEHGQHLVVCEVDDPAAKAARTRIESLLRRSLARANEPAGVVAGVMQRLRVVSSLDRLDELRPILAIESVPEHFDLKFDTLTRLGRELPGAVIATNTSALSIDRLAEALPDPERFLGMHFFNPVPRSSLVELVRGARTSAATLETARRIVSSIEKVSIEVRDSPGFATSRLGIAIGLEAMRMVEEGVASAEDIDTGMVEGYKLPIGPLALSDLVGLDVRLAIAAHLSEELGERFKPPGLLRAMVEDGALGAKSRRGFYMWSEDGRRERPADIAQYGSNVTAPSV